jgi:type II secretory pathway component PulF
MQLVQTISERFLKMQLTPALRREIYVLLAFMLENNNKMDESLKELYGIYSKDGKRPGSPGAVFLYEALQRTKEGRPFNEAISRYVSPEEASIIAAGERAGRLREAFEYAIDRLDKHKQIGRAVRGGLTYPAFLLGILVVLLYVVSYKLMPALAGTVDLSMLSGPLKYLSWVANFVTHHGPYVAVALAVFCAWAAWSLPRLTGPLRYRLEKLPPWSVYRAMQGSSFLLNVGVMLRSGTPLLSILTLLNKNATPYMRERIGAFIHGTNAGLNLGEAMRRSELDFPDETAVRLIRVFASRDHFDTALDRFAKQWAESTVDRIKKAMSGVFNVAIIAVGALVLLVVLSMADIQSVMDQAGRQ